MAWTIGSPDIMPQLLTLQDPASQYIWQPNGGAAGPSPGALLGLPLMLSEKSGASLGTRGDLILTKLELLRIRDPGRRDREATNSAY